MGRGAKGYKNVDEHERLEALCVRGQSATAQPATIHTQTPQTKMKSYHPQ